MAAAGASSGGAASGGDDAVLQRAQDLWRGTGVRQDRARALEICRSAAREGRPGAGLLLAELYVQMGSRVNQARTLVRDHRKENKPDARSLDLESRIMLALQCPASALAPAQRAAELAPRDPALHAQLAAVLGRLGRTREAEEEEGRAKLLESDR